VTPAEAFQEDQGYAHRQMLANIVRHFKNAKVIVVGDPMLDYYHFGHVDRLSPEAPVPVFIEDKIDLRDGGAANVVANLHGLKCEVLCHFPPAPYAMKHRYLVGSQQLFRIDNDRNHAGQEIERVFEPADAVVISDYGKGWCRPDRLARVIECARGSNVPVIVDPKGTDWSKYAGATVICPNQHELIPGYDSWPGHIVHKLGDRGLKVIYPDRTEHYFDPHARHVFDVTGAGDTVVAVLAAALAVRCEMHIAAELANIAAGIVVGEVGTTPINSTVLIDELER
jgi:D-beta-D-heptose 7-phosphate kinase / D-beta-D-heptose 1-phosphate adenosyltransferase